MVGIEFNLKDLSIVRYVARYSQSVYLLHPPFRSEWRQMAKFWLQWLFQPIRYGTLLFIVTMQNS